MTQSPAMSLTEAIANVVVGYGVAVVVQIGVFPLFGFRPTIKQNLTIGAVFTSVSLLRRRTEGRTMTELIDADDPSRAEIAAQGGHARAAKLERPRNGGNRHRRRNGRNWRGEEGGMTMETHMLDYRTLLEAGACDWTLALFRDLYPEGKAEVSVDNCVAVANRFDWDWAASRLLPAAAQDEYKRARAAALTEQPAVMYGRADAAALIKYNRARAAAWAQAWLTRQSFPQPQKSILRLFGHWRLWR